MGTDVKILTSRRRALLAEMGAQWQREVTCALPTHRPGAERAVSRLIALAGRAEPDFQWCASLQDATFRLCDLIESGTVSQFDHAMVLFDLLPVRHKGFGPHASQELVDAAYSEPGFSDTYGFYEGLAEAAMAILDQAPLEGAARKVAQAGSSSRIGNAFLAHGCNFHVGVLEFLMTIGVELPARVAALVPAYSEAVRSCLAWWSGRETCLLLERPRVVSVQGARADGRGGQTVLEFSDGTTVCWSDAPE